MVLVRGKSDDEGGCRAEYILARKVDKEEKRIQSGGSVSMYPSDEVHMKLLIWWTVLDCRGGYKPRPRSFLDKAGARKWDKEYVVRECV